MTKTTKKILFRFIIAPIVLLVLLYLIYLQILQSGPIENQWRELKLHWVSGNKWLFVLVLLLAPLNWLMEAYKWREGMKKVFPVTLARSYKGVLTGISFAMISPGKVGDFVGRILYVPNEVKVKATVATLLNNMIQAIATSLFGILGLMYFNLNYDVPWARYLLYAGIIAAGLLIIFWVKKRQLLKALLHWKWFEKLWVKWKQLTQMNIAQFLSVLLLSCVRFLIYNMQYVILLSVLGVTIGWGQLLMLTFLMFWLIALIPSFMVADLGVRGYIAGLLFIQTGLIDNTLLVLSASYIIWLINLVLPAIIGSILILFLKNEKG